MGAGLGFTGGAAFGVVLVTLQEFFPKYNYSLLISSVVGVVIGVAYLKGAWSDEISRLFSGNFRCS